MPKKFIELFTPKPTQDLCKTCKSKSETKSCDFQVELDLKSNTCKSYQYKERNE